MTIQLVIRLWINVLLILPLAVSAQVAPRPSMPAAATRQSMSAAAAIDPGTFLHPPDAAKPWVFWYWMQAAVSKEGIRADLQAMRSAGIGGAYLMPISGAANPPLYAPTAEQLSPRWW